MNSGKLPDPSVLHPVKNSTSVTYVKPTVKSPNIVVGDFTYFDGDFEKHVTHFYDFLGDKLIIGKFCQIASGVNFVMNGANHKMNCASTYPFYIMEGWKSDAPPLCELPLKGDTVVGNDVWIGQNVTILPGVKIGDGAIIGMNSVVGSDVPPYAVVVGNPAKVIRKRFDDELVAILEKLQWWNLPIEKIVELEPVLSSGDLVYVKKVLKEQLSK